MFLERGFDGVRVSEIAQACGVSGTKVWHAVTDPGLVQLWTATGAGARPEGFTTTVGAQFQFIAKPRPGWSGIVDCVVLEVDQPRLLRLLVDRPRRR